MRFLLLLLIVTMIVAGLAWYTGHVVHLQTVPAPAGPGELARVSAGGVAAVAVPSVAAPAAA